MPTVIRIFRASTKPGMNDKFLSFFLNEALPLVKSQEGLIKATVGLPFDQKPNEFLMITVWDSLDSLKKFSGEAWDKAVIDPREANLLSGTSIDHYYHYED